MRNSSSSVLLLLRFSTWLHRNAAPVSIHAGMSKPSISSIMYCPSSIIHCWPSCAGERLGMVEAQCERVRMLYRDCARPPPPPLQTDRRQVGVTKFNYFCSNTRKIPCCVTYMWTGYTFVMEEGGKQKKKLLSFSLIKESLTSVLKKVLMENLLSQLNIF